MEKLIDETNLMNLLYALDDARHDLCYAIKKIPELPTVEAIPKAEYEAKLKVDMVAMLTELQKEIEKIGQKHQQYFECQDAVGVIQQKINALKENEDAI